MSDRLIVPSRDDLDCLPTPLTRGERTVLDFFDEHLPDGWEIYYNPHLNGVRPDFVLLNPDVGIAVYEVKDWRLTEANCSWTPAGIVRTDTDGHSWTERRDPVRAALRNRDEISTLYCPSLRTDGAAAITAGVVLPTTTQDWPNGSLVETGPSQTDIVQRSLARRCWNLGRSSKRFLTLRGGRRNT